MGEVDVLSPDATLKELIITRKARVGIVGLGYVGLPMVVACAKEGFPVVGVDVDASKVAQLSEGRSYIPEVRDSVLRVLVARHGATPPKVIVTTDYAALGNVDIIQICVQTPWTRHKEPDTSHIATAARGIAAHGRPGQLVILRSTSYPGTTRELVLPILESHGRRVGEDTFLAFAPERIDPGRTEPPPSSIPVVVGGTDRLSADLAEALFSQLAGRVVRVSSADAAEMTKLLENIFRNVNIALVNQLAMLCDRMGLDVWEIVEAAATKPYGFMKFLPGPGVGGHCIPIDPYYLAWKAREYDFHMDFIELAARVNDEMPYFVVNKILAALETDPDRRGSPRVFVLGVTFKRDVPDARSSPAAKILDLLRRRGVEVGYHDPYVPTFTVNDHILESQPLSSDVLARYDVVVIVTDHSAVNYQWLVDHARRVVDTRNATAGITQGRERIMKL